MNSWQFLAVRQLNMGQRPPSNSDHPLRIPITIFIRYFKVPLYNYPPFKDGHNISECSGCSVLTGSTALLKMKYSRQCHLGSFINDVTLLVEELEQSTIILKIVEQVREILTQKYKICVTSFIDDPLSKMGVKNDALLSLPICLILCNYLVLKIDDCCDIEIKKNLRE